MVKKAIILCGGLATRMLPYCKSVPKEMLPLLDKPIMQYLVEELSEAGVTDILVIVGRNKECLINHFDRNIELEQNLIERNKVQYLQDIKKPENLAKITYTRQITPRGTGHAVMLAKDWVGDEPFFMVYGDEVFDNPEKSRAKQMIEVYEKYHKSVIAVQRVADMKEVVKYGNIKPKELEPHVFEVEKIVEKPRPEDAFSDITTVGPAILTKDIFECIEKTPENNFEICLTDSYQFLTDGRLVACELIGDRMDLGNKVGFIKANISKALRDPNMKDEILEYIKGLVR